ncbi:aminotransferase [Marivirga tractuosa]|uniref:Aminotransferase class I and II n=1 Tax=Marivirga tractuosa (strain ATCC 23168 / DSM 4126 / NBRC 15989 / NCIMB 1408 / VKM B-1430 / H-43) TaxID=643867 RepID=E4TQB9_MARTH|nr:histidinol-phosphate transaminase [Marivirga tractuosa]ADR22642.1 aminotransferase class I and II [Marivirga tractuosa DSM 4126]BDD16687.1 aminotransferase [Marivirga tractuosa]
MAIELTKNEKDILKKFRKVKNEAGTHSPSIFVLQDLLPDIEFKVDACYLSNPYATELFIEYLQREIIETGKFRDLVEYYPSQNVFIAEKLSKKLGVNKENLFIGNGAVEIIQALMHEFCQEGKTSLPIPTFSSYYEFLKNPDNICFYQLSANKNFELDVDDYIKFIFDNNVDNVILINPNNPNGSYLKKKDLTKLLKALKHVKNIILDESFIHFAYEDEMLQLESASNLIDEFPNLSIVKSMSKDFGIAGIRSGYLISSKPKVSHLLKNGFLWNSNGLSEYFFELYTRDEFRKEYEKLRKKYITEFQSFYNQLKKIKGIKAYPTKANFVLLELIEGSTAENFCNKLLIEKGVYSRNCEDKIGLNGEFIRIGGRTKSENQYIISAIQEILK